MRNLFKYFLLSIMLLCQAILLCGQEYCNITESCIFWEPQPEEVIDELDIIYAPNVPQWDDFTCGFNTTNLKLDMHYPDLTNGEIRPLVIVIHGGGFYTGDKSENREFSKQLASHGFIVANINYRLCEKLCCKVSALPPPVGGICEICFLETKRARYIATVDALTAAEYLIANASQYHIDTENIFFAGNSAGAVISLSAAYMTQDENEFTGLTQCFGELPIVDNIKGIAAISGALLDTLTVDHFDETAAFMVHGTCDQVVVYDEGGAYNCPNFADIPGSALLAQRMQNEGLEYQMFTVVNMDHDATVLLNTWFDEMLYFFKRILCCTESNIQEHTIVELQPESAGCTIIEQPIVELPFIRDTIDLDNTDCMIDNSNCNMVSTQNIYELPENIKIFPNPSSENMYINYLEPQTEYDVNIVDLKGVSFFQKNQIRDETIIPVKNWPSGIYMIQIRTEEKVFFSKMIVE